MISQLFMCIIPPLVVHIQIIFFRAGLIWAKDFEVSLIRAGFRLGLFVLIPQVLFFSPFSQKPPFSFIFPIDFSKFVTFGGASRYLTELLLELHAVPGARGAG